MMLCLKHTIMAAAATLTIAACHNTGTPGAGETPRASCNSDADGELRVRNFTGHTVDIYAARATAPPEFVGNASPGVSTLRVPGPSDQTVRYDAIDRSAGGRVATVTWIQRTSGGGRSSVLLELACVAAADR